LAGGVGCLINLAGGVDAAWGVTRAVIELFLERINNF